MPPSLIKKSAGKPAIVLLSLLAAACSGGGGTVNISIDDASLTEGDAGQSLMLFTVSLSAAAGDTVTVDYATNSGTAISGADFSATNGTATFVAGDTSETVSVAVTGETDEEANETFIVLLSNVTGDATIADGTGVGTILDNDTPPPPVEIRIDNVSLAEGDAGQTNMVFSISLSAAEGDTVTVDYATSPGSATAGADFVATSGTATFIAGDTSESVTVSIIGDGDVEPDESFTVALSAVTGNATIADGTGLGTILDDDVPPAPVDISINDVSQDEGDAGQTDLVFDISLSAAASNVVTVEYQTVAVSATAGADYVTRTGTATFNVGVTSQLVAVPVLGDTDEEANETFSVVLSNETGNAAVLDDTGLGTILDDDTSVPVGLAQRPSNTSCIAPDRPTADAGVATENAFPTSPGFSAVTKILQAPGDGSRWFVLQQAGPLMVFDVADPANPDMYIDLTASVANPGEGLLGAAFHPSFPAVPELYVYYVRTAGSRVSRVSRIILDDTDNPVNIVEEVLITIDQFAENHNGGDIGFGADGYLYLGLGDGGGAGDPQETAQNTTNFLGSMLRIDVLGVSYPSPGYNIPGDNPFAGNAKCGSSQSNANDCPEIYAWGLRNPFRWSFDAPTGDLWVGDVGQAAREEVDLIEKGGNYGWDCREGTISYEPTGCPAGGFVEPVSEYNRANGDVSITGGHVYRNNNITGLNGRYVFGDFASGRIWALADDGQGGYTNEELVNTPYGISSFALGEDGEIYFSDYGSGSIYRLIESGGTTADTIPDNLVDTGCVDLADPTQPASGLVPYVPNARFWSDGAVKERWLALPNNTTIDIDGDDDFVFPIGSVLMKNFELNGQLIETRLFMRHTDGVWGGYTWEWNDAVTAATRVRGGKTRQVQGQEWIYPTEGACLQCHTNAAGRSLGLEVSQQNGDFTYPSTNITANQLDTLDHIMMFTNPLPGPVSGLPAMPDPTDGTADLGERARAYLHTNCSQCHQPGGPTPSQLDLRYTTSLSATNSCDVAPTFGDLDIGANARLIAPGSAANSVIPGRVGLRDVKGMPPIGSTEIDTAGIALLNSWITSLSNCN